MDSFDSGDLEEKAERSEPFKQVGCTLLTGLALLILICSLVFFLRGLVQIGVDFYNTIP